MSCRALWLRAENNARVLLLSRGPKIETSSPYDVCHSNVELSCEDETQGNKRKANLPLTRGFATTFIRELHLSLLPICNLFSVAKKEWRARILEVIFEGFVYIYIYIYTHVYSAVFRPPIYTLPSGQQPSSA
jgi:hypothetical protein